MSDTGSAGSFQRELTEDDLQRIAQHIGIDDLRSLVSTLNLLVGSLRGAIPAAATAGFGAVPSPQVGAEFGAGYGAGAVQSPPIGAGYGTAYPNLVAGSLRAVVASLRGAAGSLRGAAASVRGVALEMNATARTASHGTTG